MTERSGGGWWLISGGDGIPASILMLKSVEDLGERGSKNDVYLAPEGGPYIVELFRRIGGKIHWVCWEDAQFLPW